MNGIIKLHFGNCTTNDKTLRMYNITSEVALQQNLDHKQQKCPKHGSSKNEIFKITIGTYNTALPKEI